MQAREEAVCSAGGASGSGGDGGAGGGSKGVLITAAMSSTPLLLSSIKIHLVKGDPDRSILIDGSSKVAL